MTPRSSRRRTRCCTAETDSPVCLASSVKLSRPSPASNARILRLVSSTRLPARRAGPGGRPPGAPRMTSSQRPADDQPLDLVRALDDLQGLGLAHVPLGGKVLDV